MMHMNAPHYGRPPSDDELVRREREKRARLRAASVCRRISYEVTLQHQRYLVALVRMADCLNAADCWSYAGTWPRGRRLRIIERTRALVEFDRAITGRI